LIYTGCQCPSAKDSIRKEKFYNGWKKHRLLDEIERWKNKRYPTENTWRYQIGGDSIKLCGTDTKIRRKISKFFIL
jgi:hypothetical protein